MIRQMLPGDAGVVAEAHLASFPGFFLSSLGPSFLAQYYRALCQFPRGIAYVYLDERERPAGFVAGTADPSGFYSSLLRRYWLRFGLASFSAVMRNPAAALRLLRAVRLPSSAPAGERIAGLFSLGVRPDMQGKGAGGMLVKAFLSEARRRGSRSVFLTTDRDNNQAVNEFYRKCGFKVGRQYTTPEGRRMNEYWIELT